MCPGVSPQKPVLPRLMLYRDAIVIGTIIIIFFFHHHLDTVVPNATVARPVLCRQRSKARHKTNAHEHRQADRQTQTTHSTTDEALIPWTGSNYCVADVYKQVYIRLSMARKVALEPAPAPTPAPTLATSTDTSTNACVSLPNSRARACWASLQARD